MHAYGIVLHMLSFDTKYVAYRLRVCLYVIIPAAMRARDIDRVSTSSVSPYVCVTVTVYVILLLFTRQLEKYCSDQPAQIFCEHSRDFWPA